jgi:phosphoribosyl 1,2-cyclic phosphodiesterase
MHNIMAKQSKFNVLFLGTGVSTAIPNLGHIFNKTNCPVCIDATNRTDSKNKRNNVSIAVTYQDESEKDRCVIVDVGKTMRDGALSLLTKHNIVDISGILLTHGHADAIFGLDDVRDLQLCQSEDVPDPNNESGFVTGFRLVSGVLPIYLNRETMTTVSSVFGYLTGEHQWLDKERKILQRRVACLDFNVIESTSTLDIHGLSVRCFPVYHGGTYISLGFSFGREGEFVYISDVKIIPATTMAYLKSISRIKTLVIDALDRKGIFAHMGLNEALDVIVELQPERAILTGMSCGMGLHEEVERELAERAPTTTLAFDGMHLSGFEMR